MDLAQLANSLVTLLVAVIGAYLLKERFDRLAGRFDRLDARVDRLEAKFDDRFDGVPTKAEVLPRLDRLEREVEALRSDLTQIALAVGAQIRPHPAG